MSSPISGFTAIPNPQMLAFMPIQSYLMMYFAGSAWQFGKRKISAKSNEEFNKLTMKTLLEEHTMELKSVIPTLEKSLDDVTPLVAILIEQYGDFIKAALAAVPQAVANIFGGGDVSSTGGREVVAIHPTAGAPKGTQFGFLGYAEQQLMQQYILDQQSRAGSEQNIKTHAQALHDTNVRTKEHSVLYKGRYMHLEEWKEIKAKERILQLQQAKRTGFGVLPSAQLSFAERNRTSDRKRKAGQSQSIERGKLVKLIQALGVEAKYWFQRNPSGPQFKDRDSRLKIAQQRLVTLLARYQF